VRILYRRYRHVNRDTDKSPGFNEQGRKKSRTLVRH